MPALLIRMSIGAVRISAASAAIDLPSATCTRVQRQTLARLRERLQFLGFFRFPATREHAIAGSRVTRSEFETDAAVGTCDENGFHGVS